MVSGEADAAFHCFAERQRLGLFDFRHGVDRNDQGKVFDGRIEERLGRSFDPDRKTFRLQPASYHGGAQIRIMSRPATPDDHRLAHLSYPLVSRSARWRGPAAAWPDARRWFRV